MDFEPINYNRRMRKRFKLPSWCIVLLAIPVMVLILIFSTDILVSVDQKELATVYNVTAVSRDNAVMETATAVDNIANDSTSETDEVTTASGTPTLTGVDYHAYVVPDYTYSEIGGYANGGGTSHAKFNVSRHGNKRVGSNATGFNVTVFNNTYGHGMSDNVPGIKAARRALVKDTATGIYCCKYNGQLRYLAGIGTYFLTGWQEDNNHNAWNHFLMYDVVLKDGTTIPFILGDVKADNHTNGGNGNYYSFSTLNMPTYRHIFQAHDGSVLEFIVQNGDYDAPGRFYRYYGITDDNPIVQIIVYNKKAFDKEDD